MRTEIGKLTPDATKFSRHMMKNISKPSDIKACPLCICVPTGSMSPNTSIRILTIVKCDKASLTGDESPELPNTPYIMLQIAPY